MIKNRHLAGAVLMGGGCLWAWALLPPSIKPTFLKSPLHKGEQTVTIEVASPDSRFVPSDNHTVKVACTVPTLLHPVMAPPDKVHVLFRFNGRIVGDTVQNCPKKS